MKNVLKLKTNHNISRAQYYKDAALKILKAGYQNPSEDQGDRRQIEVWDYIRDNNLSVRFEQNYDFVDKLYDASDIGNDSLISAAQCRARRHDVAKVNELYERLYLEGEKQKRPSIGIEFNNTFYPAVGNHRAFAHVKGQKGGKDLESPAIIIGEYDVLTGRPISKDHLRVHMHKISIKSNKQTGDETEKETVDDLAIQVKIGLDLQSIIDPELSTFDFPAQKEWSLQWFAKNKKFETKQRIGAAINRAFNEKYGAVVPMPDEGMQPKIWSQHFKKNSEKWAPELNKENQHRPRLQIPYSTTFQMLSHRLNVELQQRNQAGLQQYTAIDLILHPGKEATSLKTIEKRREEWLEDLRERNLFLSAPYKMPYVDRIVFVRQVEIDGHESEAWEWNHLDQRFEKV